MDVDLFIFELAPDHVVVELWPMPLELHVVVTAGGCRARWLDEDGAELVRVEAARC